jgi:GMP synthase (glutamine-hydrolysing)
MIRFNKFFFALIIISCSMVLVYYAKRPCILVIDNGSPLTTRVLDHLKSRAIPYRYVTCHDSVPKVLDRKYIGVIMTGGPLLYSSKAIDIEQVSLNLAVMAQLSCPILGICFGHQTMVEQFGGKMGRMPVAVSGFQAIRILKESPLFQGLPRTVFMYQGHNDHALEIPHGFECIALSSTCSIEAIQHLEKPLYGVQFHPESSGLVGDILLDNFISLCGFIK